MKSSITILITGAGSPGAPGVIKSLRSVQQHEFRIIGMDMNPDNAAKSMVDQFYIGVKATDPKFIGKCLEICKSEKVEVILPMVTAELPIFSENLKRFEEAGTTISVSSEIPLKLAINKGNLLQALNDKGFLIPRHFLVRSVKGLRNAIDALGYPDNPVCIKPAVADGSRGFRIIDSNLDRAHKLFYEKPASVYLSYHELFEILTDCTAIPELLVMEYLPGEEYSVDLLAKNGQVLVAVPRLREETESGISIKGRIVKEKDIIDYSEKIVKEIGLHGNIGVQVRRDKEHQPKILEINPRIQGTIVHCTAAGVNLPYLAVKLAKGLPIQDKELSIKWGLRMIRYWEERYFDKNELAFEWQKEV